MFAVIESGCKQYHVKVGDVVKVEKVPGEVGSIYQFEKILMVNGKAGSPVLSGTIVAAEILEQTKTDKVIVFKKKRRHNYRRKHGHRQQVTVLRIKEIKG